MRDFRMKVVALIPARKGSKRVSQKNVREVLGQPLVVFSLKAAKICKDIEKIFVSTDDPIVSKISKKFGIEVLQRPSELATDSASTFEVIKHSYQIIKNDYKISPEFLILLQPTSPLRAMNFISRGLSQIIEDPKASCLIALCEYRFFSGKISNGYWISDYPEDTRSQDLNPFYVPSGSLYIYRCSETIEKNDAFGKNVKPFLVDPALNVNIDHERDFVHLNVIYENHKKEFSYLLK